MKREISNSATKKTKGPRKVGLTLWARMQAEKNGLAGLSDAISSEPPALPQCDAVTASAALPQTRQKNVPRSPKADLASILNSLGPLPPIAAAQKKLALKRLAVDIPLDLHARMKEMTTRRGTTIRDEVTAILEKFFGKDQ